MLLAAEQAALDPSWNPTAWSASAFALMSPYALALLALAGRGLWRYLRRPRLALTAGGVAETDMAEIIDGKVRRAPPHAYGRLVVANASKREPAEDVHVLVVAYRRETPIRGERIVARMPLAWTHSAPTETLTTLYGGSPRFIDLVAVNVVGPFAQLQTHPKPVGPLGILDPNDAPSTWTLELELVARRVAPIAYTVEVSWDGDWPVNQLAADHLAVSPPTRV